MPPCFKPLIVTIIKVIHVNLSQHLFFSVAYLEIGKGVCHNLRRGADTPGAPVLMIDIRAACDTIHSMIVYLI